MRFYWSDENVATLRKLWAEGVSATQIAKQFGDGATRNAVIDKAHRLGLMGRATPSRPRRVKRVVISPRTGVTRPAAHTAPDLGPGASDDQRREYFSGQGASVLRRSMAVTAEQLAAVIVWDDLKLGQCAWILGETDGAASHCCGAPVDPDAADSLIRARYCADHGAAAIAPSQPRLTNPERVKVSRTGSRSVGAPSVFDRGATCGRAWNF